MKIKIILVLAMTFASNILFAQWTRVQNIPAQNIRALGVIGDTLIAISDSNYIYRSHDDGASWDSAAVSTGFITMISLAVIEDTIYIGTTSNGVYSSSDGGSSWVHTGAGLFAVA